MPTTKVAAQKSSAKKATPKLDNKADILKKINQVKQEAIELKRNMHLGDVQNVRAYKYKRRELARLLTRYNKAQVPEGDK
jgi:ribosomal protein L29